MLGGYGDALVKRFLKFVLKRSLGTYLESELDLEQLDVELGTGRLELRNVLLNCANVNKELVGNKARPPKPIDLAYISNSKAPL